MAIELKNSAVQAAKHLQKSTLQKNPYCAVSELSTAWSPIGIPNYYFSSNCFAECFNAFIIPSYF